MRERVTKTDRDVGPEQLVVPEKCAHVLHAALLLHAVTDVGPEPGAKLDIRGDKDRRQRLHRNTQKAK